MKVYCDSSSLISLVDSCSMDMLYFLHDEYGVRFMAPPSIKGESIDNPLKKEIKQYYASIRRIDEKTRFFKTGTAHESAERG